MDEEISGSIQKSGAQTLNRMSPKLFESDKRFIARSKEDNQGLSNQFLNCRAGGPLAGLCAKILHALCL